MKEEMLRKKMFMKTDSTEKTGSKLVLRCIPDYLLSIEIGGKHWILTHLWCTLFVHTIRKLHSEIWLVKIYSDLDSSSLATKFR